MYNIERGRGPIIGDIINSSKFSDSQQDFLLGDEKFNFISRRIDDVSEGMVNKYFYNDRLKSKASQKAPLEFTNQKRLAVIKETDLLQIILRHAILYFFETRITLLLSRQILKPKTVKLNNKILSGNVKTNVQNLNML